MSTTDIPNYEDLDQPPVTAYETTAPSPPSSNGHAPRNGTKKPAPDHTPHDHDAERNLLGAALLNAVGHQALLAVPDTAFYDPAHSTIAAATRHLITTGLTVDAITVADHLRTGGLLDTIGGLPRLSTLLADAPATSSAPAYAAIVLRHWRARRLDHAGQEISRAARTTGPDHAWDLLQAARTDVAPTSGVPWEDVSVVLTGEYAPMRPTILTRTDGQALIYPGLLHWLMGEPGKGKTWVALHVTAEQLRAGHHAIYLDWEGNRQIIGERLGALGCTYDQLDRLHYLRPPRITPQLAAAIAATVTEHEATICIFDGVAKALARNDLNEDKAADVLQWLELITHPVMEAGAAALCLDHVTKDKDTRGLWPRGSGAKQGEVSGAAWVVKPKTPFSRNTPGEITLVQAKDREGHVGVDGDTVARIHITPTESGGQVAIKIDPPAPQGPDGFRPTAFMERLSQTIATRNGIGEHPGANALFKLVPGRKEIKQLALQRLIDEGYVTTEPGPNRTLNHTSTTRYRQTDDPLSDQYDTATTTPETAPTTTPIWEDF